MRAISWTRTVASRLALVVAILGCGTSTPSPPAQDSGSPDARDASIADAATDAAQSDSAACLPKGSPCTDPSQCCPDGPVQGCASS